MFSQEVRELYPQIVISLVRVSIESVALDGGHLPLIPNLVAVLWVLDY